MPSPPTLLPPRDPETSDASLVLAQLDQLLGGSLRPNLQFQQALSAQDILSLHIETEARKKRTVAVISLTIAALGILVTLSIGITTWGSVVQNKSDAAVEEAESQRLHDASENAEQRRHDEVMAASQWAAVETFRGAWEAEGRVGARDSAMFRLWDQRFRYASGAAKQFSGKLFSHLAGERAGLARWASSMNMFFVDPALLSDLDDFANYPSDASPPVGQAMEDPSFRIGSPTEGGSPIEAEQDLMFPFALKNSPPIFVY